MLQTKNYNNIIQLSTIAYKGDVQMRNGKQRKEEKQTWESLDNRFFKATNVGTVLFRKDCWQKLVML